MLMLKISKDFSRTPGPRYRVEGDFSGEEFREQVLRNHVLQAINTGEKLTIDLDGTEGYGTSFLEEAFGGLIREDHLGYNEVVDTLHFISNEEEYLIDDIQSYLYDAKECSSHPA